MKTGENIAHHGASTSKTDAAIHTHTHKNKKHPSASAEKPDNVENAEHPIAACAPCETATWPPHDPAGGSLLNPWLRPSSRTHTHTHTHTPWSGGRQACPHPIDHHACTVPCTQPPLKFRTVINHSSDLAVL